MRFDFRRAFCVPVIVLLCLFVFAAVPSQADVIIETEPDLQNIMGDLCTLSVAMRLYYEDTHKTQCPTMEQLVHYLRKPLPAKPGEIYQTAEAGGAWWVGRKVPEYSQARRFIRANAATLGIFDRESRSPWLGGAFAWMKAMEFVQDGNRTRAGDLPAVRVVQGEGRDNQHLFFNTPGTDYFWWSNLLYTTEAHANALAKFGAEKAKGPFVIPPTPRKDREAISASPVSLPDEFSVGSSEDQAGAIQMGDVLINPVPRNRDPN